MKPKLLALIEQAGAVVVGEETCTGERYYKDVTEPVNFTVSPSEVATIVPS